MKKLCWRMTHHRHHHQRGICSSIMLCMLVAQQGKVDGFFLNPNVGIGLDLFPVSPKHQTALVEAIQEEILPVWHKYPQFQEAVIHSSIDGERVFIYSQWFKDFDHRKITPTLDEFYTSESLCLAITESRSLGNKQVEINTLDDSICHLAEFRMNPTNHPNMIKRTSEALDNAMKITNSQLISATFHRSFDGTRMFNYGQWTSIEAFEYLESQPGFSKEQPYWAGLARNEFHLYRPVFISSRKKGDSSSI